MVSVKRKTQNGAVYKKTVLKNGLRVLTEKVPSVRSVSMGVWVDVGARYETSGEEGVSHLIEHMVFKGTRDRTARQIAMSLESVGGGLNAFTSREQTCFTARFPEAHLDLAVDVLADITCNASLTPNNLKREKLVICEEIKESIENPSDQIFDLFAESYWGEHQLGKPILGTQESVLAMPRSRIRGFLDKNYRSNAVVIAASGAVSHSRLVKLARDKFSFKPGNSSCAVDAERINPTPIAITKNGNNQVHAVLGFPGCSWRDKNRLPMVLLTTYLGGGMSSVLFQKVREEQGLAYTIYVYHDVYRDGGILGTYFATDKNRLGEALSLIGKEFIQLTKRRIPESRLNDIKEQIKGQMMLSLESTASKMNRMARIELMEGRYIPLSKTIREIDRITPDQLRDLARLVFDSKQRSVAILGPADSAVVENGLNW